VSCTIYAYVYIHIARCFATKLVSIIAMNLSVSQVFNDYDSGLFGIMYCKHIFVGAHSIYTPT